MVVGCSGLNFLLIHAKHTYGHELIVALYMNRLIHAYGLKIENLDTQSPNLLLTTPLTLYNIIWGV